MDRSSERPANRYRRHPSAMDARVTSIASEWGRTFLAQTVIGVLLAFLWATLGLQ